MPRFSLIIPTLGRTAELAELLSSIVNQKPHDIEIILVDQNEMRAFCRWWKRCPAIYPSCTCGLREKNVSAARNAGMDAASGEIIAFPDDDCCYPPDLLNQVDDWFKENRALRRAGGGRPGS